MGTESTGIEDTGNWLFCTKRLIQMRISWSSISTNTKKNGQGFFKKNALYI
jgi:hypothetical protein